MIQDQPGTARALEIMPPRTHRMLTRAFRRAKTAIVPSAAGQGSHERSATGKPGDDGQHKPTNEKEEHNEAKNI
jgi:hypothetical protein